MSYDEDIMIKILSQIRKNDDVTIRIDDINMIMWKHKRFHVSPILDFSMHSWTNKRLTSIIRVNDLETMQTPRGRHRFSQHADVAVKLESDTTW
jgi:hypothetical protein